MDTFSMIHDARILIVGGTDSDAGALEPMLRDAGYTSIALANDHLGARELHNKNRYDLVLVDLDAPSLDGSQLMYELRGLAPDACPPVVVLAEQQCRRMRAIQEGAKDFISKPLDMAEVLVRVRNTLEASHLSPLFDSLTGLPARVLFLAMLQNALHRTEVYRRSVALLLLDLDRFRNVNVPLGFRLGDEMLRQVAHRLGQCRTAHHILARTGGDEFAFIVPRLESRDSVLALADKALEVIRQPIQLEEHEVRACASMGIAFYPDDGVTAETLMTCAERALYRAKEEGRDTFRVFSG